MRRKSAHTKDADEGFETLTLTSHEHLSGSRYYFFRSVAKQFLTQIGSISNDGMMIDLENSFSSLLN